MNEKKKKEEYPGSRCPNPECNARIFPTYNFCIECKRPIKEPSDANHGRDKDDAHRSLSSNFCPICGEGLRGKG